MSRGSQQTGSPNLDGWVRAHFDAHLHTVSSPLGWELGDIVGLALRRNPRRAHLLVSTVLGKHVPADPRTIRGVGLLLGLLVAHQELEADPGRPTQLEHVAAALLAGRFDELSHLKAGPAGAEAVVFGFAETATGLGHCVAEALGAAWYLHSTRREIVGVPVAARFEEGHSHATSHLVQPIPADLVRTGPVLVLVDDELSTGTTAMQAIAELHRLQPRRKYIIAALIDLRAPGDVQAMKQFGTALGCEISVVALVSGSVELPAGLAAAAHSYIQQQPVTVAGPIAGTAPVRIDIPWPADLPEGGRHGFLAADFAAFETAAAAAAELIRAGLPPAARRVLVIGTEEFSYLPLRLAGLLADLPGRQARFQTTTRSPVHAEPVATYPVQRGFSFVSPEGDTEAPRYLYNADWRSPDGRPDDSGQSVDGSTDTIVLVIDQAMDRPELLADDGLLAVIGQLGVPVVLAVIAGCRPDQLRARR